MAATGQSLASYGYSLELELHGTQLESLMPKKKKRKKHKKSCTSSSLLFFLSSFLSLSFLPRGMMEQKELPFITYNVFEWRQSAGKTKTHQAVSKNLSTVHGGGGLLGLTGNMVI